MDLQPTVKVTTHSAAPGSFLPHPAHRAASYFIPSLSWAAPGSLTHLWVIHGFDSAVICRAQRCEVDENIHLWVLPHGI